MWIDTACQLKWLPPCFHHSQITWHIVHSSFSHVMMFDIWICCIASNLYFSQKIVKGNLKSLSCGILWIFSYKFRTFLDRRIDLTEPSYWVMNKLHAAERNFYVSGTVLDSRAQWGAYRLCHSWSLQCTGEDIHWKDKHSRSVSSELEDLHSRSWELRARGSNRKHVPSL